MAAWIPARAALSRPLHLSLAEAIEVAIEDGRLAPGTRLPTHRGLAARLGLSTQTVSKAYLELQHRGLVAGRVGRGTEVLDPGAGARQPFLLERGSEPVIDLSISRLPASPSQIHEMRRGLAELAPELAEDLCVACRPNLGLARHRRSGARWLERCGLEVAPERVVLTNGVCHGLALALSAAARPGEVVVTEAIAHHLIGSLGAYLGLRVHGLPVDAQGITAEGFERACREHDVKALFTVPTLANPAVMLMGAERRAALAAIARRYRVTVVEDDAWGPLVDPRPAPLAALLPDQALYLTGLSKCLMPGLRVGFLVVPERLLAAITGRMVAFGWMATPLVMELGARWIDEGRAEPMVRRHQRHLVRLHRIVAESMDGLDWNGHPQSLHFWLHLPARWPVADLIGHARAAGVAIAPPDPFRPPDAAAQRAVRVGLGTRYDPGRLARALGVLRALVRAPPEPLPAPF